MGDVMAAVDARVGNSFLPNERELWAELREERRDLRRAIKQFKSRL